MKRQNENVRLKHGVKYLVFLLIAVLIVGIIIFVVKHLGSSPPTLSGVEGLKAISAQKSVNITISSRSTLKDVEIFLTQDKLRSQILSDKPSVKEKGYSLTLEPKRLGFRDGDASIAIIIKSGFFGRYSLTLPSKIDTVPPVVGVSNCSYLAAIGSAASALIEAKDAASVVVKVGEDEFPATNRLTNNPNLYYAIFPIRTDLPTNTPLIAIARDEAGNSAKAAISTRLKPFAFKKDTLNISDSFIQSKVYPLLEPQDSKLPPIDAFKKVNEAMRGANEAVIRKYTSDTTEKILFDGPFIQMKNSKVFANFNESREYKYNGEIISHSRHMGYDLAALKNSDICASNSGVVVYTGNNGIYGNIIIIDHGMSVYSLYGHLSSINVEKGKAVKKDEFIGKSGETGLAGGDHLHFAMLIHGYYVTPVTWWDAKWVREKIFDVLHNK